MDQEEKQLVEEANALRHRELDIAEKRNAALLAILRASLVTLAALAAAGWGISVLAQLDLPWGRAVYWTSVVLVILSASALFSSVLKEDDLTPTRIMFAGVVFLGAVFSAALTCAS